MGNDTKAAARAAALGPVRFGVVLLKDWTQDPVSGLPARGYAGLITFIETSDLGIEKPGDHSWCVKVEHSGHSESHVYVLGCQIRAVRFYGVRPEKLHHDFDELLPG